MKRPAQSRPFSLRRSAAPRFISRSQNKLDGTANHQEHQAIPFVVRAGNAEAREETFDE
jgi:hypothetical protein